MIENPVLEADELSREIVSNLLAQELQDYADDEDTNLVDPTERGNHDAPFVMTSYPTATTALYPHLIVSEENTSLNRISPPSDLWEGTFTAGIQIEATNDTEKFKLKDAVRGFVVRKLNDKTFENAGFADVEIEGTTATDWDPNSETTGQLVTINGLVHIK